MSWWNQGKLQWQQFQNSSKSLWFLIIGDIMYLHGLDSDFDEIVLGE